jgi:hypothetical protein
VYVVIIAAVVVAAVVMTAMTAPRFSLEDVRILDWVPLLGLLLLQFPVLLLAIAVHELGHALAGLAAGFGLAGVQVGPVCATRTPAGWRTQISWDALWSGGVLVDPVRPDHLRRRHAAGVAGGPAAHLVLLAVVAGAAGAGRPALWLSAAVIAAVLPGSLMPVWFGLRGRWTDGRWLLAWLVQPERAAQRVGLGELHRAREAGRLPRDWDRCWVELAAGPPTPADRDQVAGSMLAYFWALDRGEVERAAGLLGRVFAARRLLSDRAAAEVAIEAAFFEAHCLGNHDRAARLLESGLPALPVRPLVDRARAAVDLAAGRPGAALAACERALAALDRAGPPRRGEIALLREQLAAMRDQARRVLAAEQPAPASPAGTASQ